MSPMSSALEAQAKRLAPQAEESDTDVEKEAGVESESNRSFRAFPRSPLAPASQTIRIYWFLFASKATNPDRSSVDMKFGEMFVSNHLGGSKSWVSCFFSGVAFWLPCEWLP